MSVFDDEDGWAYCKPCNRLVETDDDGRLIRHRNGPPGVWSETCPGSNHKPYRMPRTLDQTMDQYYIPVDLNKEGYSS